MAKYLIARLHFLSPLHVGETGIGLEKVCETVHSDTLFSAICHAWTLAFGGDATDSIISACLVDDPPFLISSLFPFHRDMFFLPRPLGAWPVPVEYRKEFKKARYIPLPIFIALASGNPSMDWESLTKAREYLQNSYLNYLVPRVTLDRVSNTSSIYHCGLVSFAKGSGLYSLFKLNDEGREADLRTAMNLLGDQGLGGEKTSGCGVFTAEWLEPGEEWAPLLSSIRGTKHCTLSLFYPGNADRGFSAGAAYEVLERKGWSSSPLDTQSVKRKSCRMLSEGSILPREVKGALVDVTPAIWQGSHRLYRNGMALTVPIGGEWQ